MISFDQLQILNQKIESAVAKIGQLTAENDALRRKCAELTNALSAKTEQLSAFQTDQSKIELRIKKALEQLENIPEINDGSSQAEQYAQSGALTESSENKEESAGEEYAAGDISESDTIADTDNNDEQASSEMGEEEDSDSENGAIEQEEAQAEDYSDAADSSDGGFEIGDEESDEAEQEDAGEAIEGQAHTEEQRMTDDRETSMIFQLKEKGFRVEDIASMLKRPQADIEEILNDRSNKSAESDTNQSEPKPIFDIF
ncbi:MAG: cell division protein ZapB [Treponema sp.]|nr:cell division protein ZapB [Treponema sp.]